jgi:hypothetical protein
VDFARLRRENDFLAIDHLSHLDCMREDLRMGMLDSAKTSSPFFFRDADPVNSAVQILQNIVISN